jgi:FkbM family methyltransferase
MPLEVLKCLGLAELATQVWLILRDSPRPLTADAVDALVALADRELETLDIQRHANQISKEVFTRRRFAILCALKLLCDERDMSSTAWMALNQYLSDEKRMIPHTLTMTFPNGCLVDCRMTDYVEFMTWFYGLYEPLQSYVFNTLIGEGMVVIDGGANIGQYSLLAATKVGQSGAVHSFEPYRGNFEKLSRNVVNNGLGTVCQLSNCALWGRDGEVSLVNPSSSLVRSYQTNNGAYQVCEEFEKDDSSLRVRSTTLDTYVRERNIRSLDVIKLDVEGAERYVLDGAREVLAEYKPIVFMEVNEQVLRSRGSSSSHVWERMTRIGYQRVLIADPRRSEASHTHHNYVFQAIRRPELPRDMFSEHDAQTWALKNAFCGLV